MLPQHYGTRAGDCQATRRGNSLPGPACLSQHQGIGRSRLESVTAGQAPKVRLTIKPLHGDHAENAARLTAGLSMTAAEECSLIAAATAPGSSGVMNGRMRWPVSSISAVFLPRRLGSRLAQ